MARHKNCVEKNTTSQFFLFCLTLIRVYIAQLDFALFFTAQMLYLPLDGDLTDHSGIGRNGIIPAGYSAPSFTCLDKSINCSALFMGNQCISVPSLGQNALTTIEVQPGNNIINIPKATFTVFYKRVATNTPTKQGIKFVPINPVSNLSKLLYHGAWMLWNAILKDLCSNFWTIFSKHFFSLISNLWSASGHVALYKSAPQYLTTIPQNAGNFLSLFSVNSPTINLTRWHLDLVESNMIW